jgi:hypothetical protein
MSGSGRREIQKGEVAEVWIKLVAPLVFDRAETLTATGRLVVVDDFHIAGGGIVLDARNTNARAQTRDPVHSRVTSKERAHQNRHRACVIELRGPFASMDLLEALERRLFEQHIQAVAFPASMRGSLGAVDEESVVSQLLAAGMVVLVLASDGARKKALASVQEIQIGGMLDADKKGFFLPVTTSGDAIEQLDVVLGELLPWLRSTRKGEWFYEI